MKFVIHVAIYEGVPINVSTEANTVKIYFVIYLEKIKKQSHTKICLG
jgi:hypothetical protein